MSNLPIPVVREVKALPVRLANDIIGCDNNIVLDRLHMRHLLATERRLEDLNDRVRAEVFRRYSFTVAQGGAVVHEVHEQHVRVAGGGHDVHTVQREPASAGEATHRELGDCA